MGGSRWKPGEGWLDRECARCGQPFRVERNVANATPSLWCGSLCANRTIAENRAAYHAANRLEAVKLYVEGGLTYAQVGERLGLTATGAYLRIKHAGVPGRPSSAYKRRPRTPEERAALAARHLRGTHHPGYRDIPMEEIKRDYLLGMTTRELGQRHGVSSCTIEQRLRKSGVQLRPKGFSRYQRSADGHLVQSRLEARVDDWLSGHELGHVTQPYCPWWKRAPKKRDRADFKVGDVYIEVWGLTNSPAFKARRSKRMAKYRRCGVAAISVFAPEILAGDYSALEGLLA